jgi:hypothetical protein
MSLKIKDRHLLGAGVAACAVCCAPPLLALLGVAGAGLAATIATVAFAGLAFGAIVLAASLLTTWARHRGRGSTAPCTDKGLVEVAIGTRPPDSPQQSHTDR